MVKVFPENIEDSASRPAPVQVVPPESDETKGTRKVDIRLPGKGNSKSRGARPVY